MRTARPQATAVCAPPQRREGPALKYAYTPRRRRPRRWGPLWLALPLAIVVVAVALGLWLAGGSGGSSTADTACEGEDCPAAVLGLPLSTPVPVPIGHDAPPTVTAQAAAVIEEPCGAVLHSVNAHQPLPPASLTKIATAVVAAERAQLADIVTVDVDGGDFSITTDSTVMGLKPGQRLTMRDLLYGLLLPSGSDAAIAIAEHVGGSVDGFVELMNQKVQQMGLADTRFSNPHGLDDPGLYTSAFDIAMLGGELLRQPDLAAIVRTPEYQPAWDGPSLRNVNLLLGLYQGALGIKTGYTDTAGQTIVAAAERHGRRLIVSVLKSSDIYPDATALLDWAFGNTAPACASASAG